MDYIHTLLIMEDDLDEGAEVSASHMAAQTSLEGSEPGPLSVSALPWCKSGVRG